MEIFSLVFFFCINWTMNWVIHIRILYIEKMSASDDAFTGNFFVGCSFVWFWNSSYIGVLICFSFLGEYFVSLKNYKIPLKTVAKPAQFDANNPPPPGCEDETPISNETDSYVSPLALVNQPPQTEPGPPSSKIPIHPNKNSSESNNSSPKSNKRSSLFSKWILHLTIFTVDIVTCATHW